MPGGIKKASSKAMNNWYVVTGSPSSGKTTVLIELEKRGYTWIPEAARVFIDQEIARGKTITQIRKDELLFQKKIFDMKINTEQLLSPTKVIFFDRAIPDTMAYMLFNNCEIAPEIVGGTIKSKYKRVFLFEQLPFEQDYARTEDSSKLYRLELLLETVYKKLNIPIVRVPVLPVKSRVEFILDNIT